MKLEQVANDIHKRARKFPLSKILKAERLTRNTIQKFYEDGPLTSNIRSLLILEAHIEKLEKEAELKLQSHTIKANI